MERIAVGDAELEFDDQGSGEPVVPIHGSGPADSFLPVAIEPAVRDDYRVIRYHRRGSAGSSPVQGPVAITRQAADCRALLGALGIAKAHVVDHSYGGAVALQLALDAPEVVQTLALFELAVPLSVPRQGSTAVRLVQLVPLTGTIAALIAGCGGETKTTTVVRTETREATTTQPPPTTTTTPDEATGSEPSTDCEAKGHCRNEHPACRAQGRRLRRRGRRDGEGRQQGDNAYVAQMNVSFGGYRTAKTLSASTGTEAASGTYVIVTLTVANKLSGPVAIDAEQFQLGVGNRTFTSDFDAGNMPGNSFIWNDEEIQPGNSKTGTVIFDVATSSVPRIETSGILTIYQFSDAGSDQPERTVGFIRLYK